MLFDSATPADGSVQGNTITIHVPYSAIPAAKSSGVLYSATAFTATTAGTLSGNEAGVFNLTDATVPFDVNLSTDGSHATVLPLPSGWARIPLGLAAMGLLAWCAWRTPSPLPKLRRLRTV